MKYDKRKLYEDTLGQAIEDAKDVLGDVKVVSEEDQVFSVLEAAYQANVEANEEGINEFVSVCLVGEAGTGKTSRVKQWCKRHNPPLRLVQKDAKTMDIADLGGLYAPNDTKTMAINLPNGAFNELAQPDTVLFLDEFNRASSQVRFTLAQLIDEHKIPDSTQEGSYRYFPTLQLVVAAINPADYGKYNTEPLDAAELNRFMFQNIQPNNRETLNYLIGLYDERMENAQKRGNEIVYKRNLGRKQIAQTLLTNREFEFDDGDDIGTATENQSSILSPRSFTRLLQVSQGEKDKFLFNWNKMCNPNKKGMVERILANYQDVDDKANSVFKSDSPFKKNGSDTYKKLMYEFDNNM